MPEDAATVDPVEESHAEMSDTELEDYLSRCTEALKEAVRGYGGG